MSQKCVTWKQPDGDHFNGWCTNRFRLTNPPEDVRVQSGCRICVDPVSLVPPTNCSGCGDFVEDGAPWPSSYTIRGSISAPTDTPGVYTTTATNATGVTTRYSNCHDFRWSEIASIFAGGRLNATFQAPGISDCSWRRCITEVTAYRQGSGFNYTVCSVFRNRPFSQDRFVDIGRVESPLTCRWFNPGPVPADTTGFTYPQCVPAAAFGTHFDSFPFSFYPSFVVQWPSGYGVLSGTDLRFSDYGANTQDPIYPDCPSAGAYGGNVMSKTLSFVFSVDAFMSVLQVAPVSCRVEYFTFYNTTTGIWARTFDEIAPFDIPATGMPNPPYGVTYRGPVDCFQRNYFKMTKYLPAQPDPLGVYPNEIELIGGAA